MLLDFSRDECKRILRKLELEAYAAIVSAFRAQGELTKDKKKLLQELSAVLSISLERHRAEIRRAVNDERLNTIADRIYGPNTSVDWAIEGRRLIPLLPRLVPQTAFTAVANSVASIQAAKNATMPLPSASGVKEGAIPTTSSAPPTPSRTPTPTQTCRVSLPGTIPVKGTPVNGNNAGNSSSIMTKLPQEITEENQIDDFNGKKRKRSASLDSAPLPEKVIVSSNPLLSDQSSENQAPEKPVTTVNNGILCSNTPITTISTPASITRTFATTPIRITLPSSQKQNTAVNSTSVPKQVVLQQLHTSNTSTTSNVFQRSVNIPVVKTVSTTAATMAATVTQKQSKQTSSSVQGTLLLTGKISNSTTTGQCHPLNMPVATVATMARSRPKTLPPPRQSIRPRSSVLAINQSRMQFVGQNFTTQLPTPVAKSSLQISTPIHVKQVSSDGRTVQIRQEGGVKIVAQGLPVAASKILPKPTSSPIVMVSSTQGSNTPKFSTSSTVIQNQMGTKMVNLTSAQSSQSTSKVATIGNVSLVSRTTQGFPTRTGSAVVQSPGVKPNVIVVHKAQVWPQSQGQGTTIVVSGNPVPKLSAETVQEAVTYIQKQERGRSNSSPAVVSVSSCTPSNISALKPTTVNQFDHLEKESSNSISEDKNSSSMNSKQTEDKGEIDKKNNLLADVIEASGILSDGSETSFPPSSTTKTPLPREEEKVPEEIEEPTETVVIDKESEVLNIEESWTDESRLQEITSSENDEKQSEDVLNVDTTLSIEDINLPLSQLEEGQILEIQTQDDVGVLSESTRITKEMLELLQQAGLHIQEIEVKSDLSNDSYQGSVPVKSVSEEENIEVKSKETCSLLKPEDNDSCEKLILCQREEYESSEVEKQIVETANTKNVETLENKDEKCIEEENQTDEQTTVIELLNTDFGGSQIDATEFIETQSEIIPDINLAKCNSNSTEEDSNVNELPAIHFPSDSYQRTDDVKVEYISSIPEEEIYQKKSDDEEDSDKNINVNVHSNVRVERSGLDTSTMNLEDFTSQRVEGNTPEHCSSVDIINNEIENTSIAEISEEQTPNQVEAAPILESPEKISDTSKESTKQLENPSEGGEEQETPSEGSNIDVPVRRKRKLPIELQELPHLTGWSRMASGLLEKVCKYRGSGRLVGAAHWFLQPVTPSDAPGYYDIVKRPMDFSTIKKKLESGQYKNLEEFHADMMLIKANCDLYNPPGHEARTDGEEVFTFYLQEYNRIVEKWQKSHLLSSSRRSKSSKD